jgi:hypothetical protein
MGKTSTAARDAHRHEVLGRIFHSIREQHLRDYLPKLDWWRMLDGGWAIEWQDGPYVDEVALKLLRASFYREGDDYDSTLFGRVIVVKSVGQTYGELRVDGVRLSLRALDPVGWDETYERAWGELRTMMAGHHAAVTAVTSAD